MTARAGRLSGLVVGLLATLAGAPVLAADPYEAVQAASAEARGLATDGRWEEARGRLESRLGACPDGPPGRACRLLAWFALGYLAERQAVAAGDGRDTMLDEAARRYEAVLGEAPDHAATLENLALVHLARGDPTAAERLLERRLAVEPEGAVDAALRLGDLRREDGRLDAALAAYRQAAERDPSGEAPRLRMVDLYGRLPPARLAELYRVLRTWQPRFPMAAEAGFRTVFLGSRAADLRLAERALLDWVVTLARRGRITVGEIAIPPDPPGMRAPLEELRRFLVSPATPPPRGSWWRSEVRRQEALAEVALALGRASLVAGDPAGAAARWEVGLEVAPDPGRGDRIGARYVRLDLFTELASLLWRNPALDPAGRRLTRLVDDLFQGKAWAYSADDLEAVQRHHTVLGVIYAERGVWRSGHPATNAVFQLDRAVRTAEAREHRTGYYQPLAELRALLARGYAALGEAGKSAETALGAVADYLDADDTATAEALLRSTTPTTAAARALRDALERVADTRSAIARATADAVDPRSPAYAFGGSRHGWLASGRSLSPLPEAFVVRQRFKALADLSTRAKMHGRSAAAAELAGLAFDVAAGSLRTLVGTADLIRVERVGRALTADFALERRDAAVELGQPDGPGAPAPRAPAGTWYLFLPGETRPALARMSGDWLLAGRLARVLQTDPRLTGLDARVGISGGRATIVTAGDADAVRAVTGPLRAVEGLKDLVVREGGAGRHQR